MTDEIVPTNLQSVSPLLKKYYEDALAEQLKHTAVVYGSFKRTPEEEERIKQAREKRDKESKELLDTLSTATGIVREIIDLHSTDSPGSGYDECNGCDYGGCEGDKPAWPCRTIELIAESLRESNGSN